MSDPKIHESIYWPTSTWQIQLAQAKEKIRACWIKAQQQGVSMPEAVRSLAQMDRYKYPDGL
jgi:hypothetical protein